MPSQQPCFWVPDIGPFAWTLIIYTETTTDAAQQLHFGCYELRDGDTLHEAGPFYDPASLTADEQALISRHAERAGYQLMTVAAFIEAVFYGIGYDLGATIVGFNMPRRTDSAI